LTRLFRGRFIVVGVLNIAMAKTVFKDGQSRIAVFLAFTELVSSVPETSFSGVPETSISRIPARRLIPRFQAGVAEPGAAAQTGGDGIGDRRGAPTSGTIGRASPMPSKAGGHGAPGAKAVPIVAGGLPWTSRAC
jgi:hypothetical protein